MPAVHECAPRLCTAAGRCDNRTPARPVFERSRQRGACMQDTPERRVDAPVNPLIEPDPGGLQVGINGKPYFHTGDAQMPLLWYLRDVLRLTGTKYGCGVGACGACTVLVDGKAARSCQLPMLSAAGREITTIEGLEGNRLHPVQQAWIEEDVAQCGYCQAGQIMAAVDLLARTAHPNENDIAAIGNLCRCGTYPRIRRAILRAVDLTKAQRS
jgi:isoquinoline 1-oxidoreductase alpha subunit